MKKTKKDPRVYLEDILSAIERIQKYTSIDKEKFLHDGLVQDATIRQISIIGEASAKVPIAIKNQHASIPWKKIVGMRNVVVHDYSEVSLLTVWTVIERDLPLLKTEVQNILNKL